MSPFIEQLQRAWDSNDSLVCVGLDPEIERFPPHNSPSSPRRYSNSTRRSSTRPPISSAPTSRSSPTMRPTKPRTSSSGRSTTSIDLPGIPVILDSKRGDVGNTAERYAIEAFERYHADAVTVSPYLGGDSLEPFLKYEDKGVIILCRTSNPGAGDLQDLEISGRRAVPRCRGSRGTSLEYARQLPVGRRGDLSARAG